MSLQRKKLKCTWCNKERVRNDLCNACRQKVESRARRLVEQKLVGDSHAVSTALTFLRDTVISNPLHSKLSVQQYHAILDDILPFLVR